MALNPILSYFGTLLLLLWFWQIQAVVVPALPDTLSFDGTTTVCSGTTTKWTISLDNATSYPPTVYFQYKVDLNLRPKEVSRTLFSYTSLSLIQSFTINGNRVPIGPYQLTVSAWLMENQKQTKMVAKRTIRIIVTDNLFKLMDFTIQQNGTENAWPNAVYAPNKIITFTVHLPSLPYLIYERLRTDWTFTRIGTNRTVTAVNYYPSFSSYFTELGTYNVTMKLTIYFENNFKIGSVQKKIDINETVTQQQESYSDEGNW